jgi:hypothetical protein
MTLQVNSLVTCAYAVKINASKGFACEPLLVRRLNVVLKSFIFLELSHWSRFGSSGISRGPPPLTSQPILDAGLLLML